MMRGMNRLRTLSLLLLGVMVVGVTGYLGYQGLDTGQGNVPPVATPPTIKVTRGTVQQTVSAPATLLGTREVALGMPVGGRVAAVQVRPGDRVAAGVTLALLDTSELQRTAQQRYADYLTAQLTYSQTLQGPDPAELQAAQAALLSVQAAYTDVITPPTANDMAALVAALHNAEAAWQQAQTVYENSPDRASATLAREQTKNELAAAQAAYANALAPPMQSTLLAAQAQIATATAQLAALQPDPLAIAQAKVHLDQAHQAWQEAVTDVTRATLTAPFTGVVTEIQAIVGATVAPHAELMRMADPTALEVEAKVIEEDLPLVQIGQTVEVYFDAVPDLLATGRVRRINPLRLAGDRPLYGVYITLEQTPPEVVAGMSSDVAIIIAQRENVLQLPRAMVRSGANGSARVEVWTQARREVRPVNVGLRGDVYVEIVAGLAEGEEVITQ